jgi:hypothetical protein
MSMITGLPGPSHCGRGLVVPLRRQASHTVREEEIPDGGEARDIPRDLEKLRGQFPNSRMTRRLAMWRKAGFDFPGYGGELGHEKPLESGSAALG